MEKELDEDDLLNDGDDDLDDQKESDEDDDLEDDDYYDEDEDDLDDPDTVAFEAMGKKEDSGAGEEHIPMEKIEWDEALSVDIPEIDDLQKKMFSLLNDLVDCRENGCCAKDASAMVARLIDESRYYFGKEEEFLRRCGYPECDTHSKEHRQFIKSVINIRRQVAEDRKNLSYDVIKSLREWVVAHIVKHDLMYVPFVRINRYIDESRQKR
ncbi:Methyl-accepting chemotaxis protein (Hemerythrin family protein) (modular protein) [Desulfamplus magnetovallimortis]|uniref:Methyl-accepting chemotaxis protein (Hemerythrin family protein) (Modular protein) n=1 Tax=Desulfamplus magnetovallimortis TaxID=1246637 RepID=A0A1W1HDL2_9BACT|nr:bacteriohemerythrin [Desulfamplus magnetovallimortis]SLM30581.1 Methyl-accepting chemotaxis protein (Hemerythrin family protein) (modular protein) [Desulfamplus magnetovallimortis]